jgi:hypothetical protein
VSGGDLELLVRAADKIRDKLLESGKLRVKPEITFTPTGGTPATQRTRVKLLKKL